MPFNPKLLGGEKYCLVNIGGLPRAEHFVNSREFPNSIQQFPKSEQTKFHLILSFKQQDKKYKRYKNVTTHLIDILERYSPFYYNFSKISKKI